MSEWTEANVSAGGNDTCSATCPGCRSRSASAAPNRTTHAAAGRFRNGETVAQPRVFADAAYQGLVGCADNELGVQVDIRRRPEGHAGFVPLQPLWRVERTFAWLGRNRRLLYDYEATVTSSEAFVHTAAVALMLGRLHSNG